uniref:Uncharacterized protein n=1 Tax=Fagus sylvatica TaxID=28930 RepID=A0A2N9HDZ4_FAGSY
MTRRKRSTAASAKAQKMWKRAGPPHHPVVHGELSSGPQQTQSPKKRSAAAPAAANDEGSDEEDEARLKRLRNLPWPPKSLPSEAGNDEKPAGYFLYPLVTVDLSTNQSTAAPAGTQKDESRSRKALRNLPWPPPLEDNDHHGPALRWS